MYGNIYIGYEIINSMGMMDMMLGYPAGYGYWNIFWMLLFFGVLIWIVITLINLTNLGKKEEDPSAILKKRYASGEISQKQYEKIKKELLK
ncbi:MAG: SHOCT domain-containing protein [Nanoarchaeota archaeon]